MTKAALAIALGRFVNVGAFDAVSKIASDRLPDRGHRQLFAMGWNGLGVRARGAEQHQMAFDRLFVQEPAASGDQRFMQDDELFGFVTQAMAATEAIVFSSFIVARAYDSDPLEERQLKGLLGPMLRVIEKVPATKPLADFVNAARVEADAVSLIDLRDVLLHRGRPPRHHWMGGRHHGKITIAENPKGVPSAWRPDRYFEAGGLMPWCTWLERYVTRSVPLVHGALLELP